MAGVDRMTDMVGKQAADRLVDADCRLADAVDRMAAGVDRPAAVVGWPLGEEEFLRMLGQEVYRSQDHQILQEQDFALVV